MAKEKPPEAIYENETRHEKIVSLQQDGEITITERMATFLKPTAKNLDEAVGIPDTPLLSQLHDHDWSSMVIFRGWKRPQRRWKEWVDRLAPKYAPTWIKAGIFDAIMCSTYVLLCNHELLLGLSEYWCSETNTFVFPWGETTITLEDVMILGGYSVLGDPVTSSPSPTKELTEIPEKLRKYRIQVQRCRAQKASHGGWMKFFMEEQREYEHAAFLSLWLSRFCFHPFSEELIDKNVFPIAAKLSLGIKVALAPAVLASLYKDLRKLSEEAMTSLEKIIAKAPFQLLQIWAFERFPYLAPESPNSLQLGEPRVARWHKLKVDLSIPIVRFAIESAKNFRWRPYAADVKNWKHPSYYSDTDQLLDSSSLANNDEMLSFLEILRVSQLVGLECEEKYLPHRVAMQFGMDQDLPGEFSNFELTREFVDFYIPERQFQPGVTVRYHDWWKNLMAARENSKKDNDILSKKVNLPVSASQKNGITEDGASRPIDSKYDSYLITPDIPSEIRKQIVQDWCDDDDLHPLPVSRPDMSCTPASSAVLSSPSEEPITATSVEDNEIKDSYDDDAPIASCIRKPSHASSIAASPISNVVTGSSKKRNLSSQNQGPSQKKVTFHSSVEGAAKEVKGRESGESTKTHDFTFTKEGKTEADGFRDGGTTDPPEEN